MIDGTQSNVELTRFINECIQIAKPILTTQYWRQLRHFVDGGMTADYVACRGIENLFLRKNGIVGFEMRKYFTDRWDDVSAVTELELKNALFILFRRKLHQLFPDLYGEIDPQYKKIRRNVLEELKRGKEYHSFPHVRGRYIHRAIGDAMHLELPEYPLDELLASLMMETKHEEATTDLLRCVFDILDSQDRYRRAILESDLLLLLRDFHTLRFRLRGQAENCVAPREPETCDDQTAAIRTFASLTVDVVRHRQLQRMVVKKKISETVADGYCTAIESYLLSLCDGEAKNLFDAFREAFDTSDYELYRRSRHRKRLEYLVQLARNDFIDRCSKYFGWK